MLAILHPLILLGINLQDCEKNVKEIGQEVKLIVISNKLQHRRIRKERKNKENITLNLIQGKVQGDR